MVTASANGHAPALTADMFRVRPITRHIVFDRPEVNDYLTRPLELDVRINVTRGEVEQATTLLRALLEAEQAHAAERDNEALATREDGARLAYFAYIAPWVTGWNLEQELIATGELADVPPPAVAGATVFELFPVRAQQWIAPTIQNAWLGDDTISKLARRPDATASTEGNVTPMPKRTGASSSSTSRRSRRENSK